ncbi:DUF1499 domain-containing protein [Hyphomicrobium sp.]|uniref:DUF1499 domain-containing protein n=1 Tax=Hyphomicrobium sp. TaxID=82 RepID=UPI002E307C9C|nr:DUF1499 domain-containing protein [Hyphomicrobium sp.]HEX2842957.1 DUF1499 domain-containing protein [Hyphomicrobium sp.]
MLAVPEREPSASRWASRTALFSFGLIVAAAFLHRLFGMPTPVAFNLLVVALGVAVLAILSAVIAAAIIWNTGRPGTARVLFAVCFSLVLLAAPVLYLAWVRNYPLLSDITTDFDNPPAFAALARLRGPGDNPVGYDRAFAEEQMRAYSDIRPMTIARSSEEAYALVVDAVKRLRMEREREDPPDLEKGTPGIIEAVDRTLILGLYQDVAIRITGGEESARVDIRSASRFGHSDMGRNAERVRELMKEIRARVDATMPTAEDAREEGAKRGAKPERAGGPKSENRRKSRVREQ